MFIEPNSHSLALTLPVLFRGYADVYQSPRAVVLMNSEGLFSSIVPCQTKADPVAVPIVRLSDKFCSRGSLTPSSSIVPSFAASSRARNSRPCFASRDIHETAAFWHWRATSRTLRIAVGGHPPFVSRVIAISHLIVLWKSLCAHL